MVEKASTVFDKVYVVASTNPDKSFKQYLTGRLQTITNCVKHLKNVEVVKLPTQAYLVEFASFLNADFLIRGIRNASDYEYETVVCDGNRSINPKITSIYLIPPAELSRISSSTVRGLIGYDGWEDVVENYLPRASYNNILTNNDGLHRRFKTLMMKFTDSNLIHTKYLNLKDKYGEDHIRHYHNMIHLKHCLDAYDDICGTVDFDEALVELAIWYHDAIYEPGEFNNEERSALFMEEELRGLLNDKQIAQIHKIIIATKHLSGCKHSNNEKVMIDVDLCDFAVDDYEYFLQQNRDIKTEFELQKKERMGRLKAFNMKDFDANRISFLNTFFDKKKIYYFTKEREHQARQNLTRFVK